MKRDILFFLTLILLIGSIPGPDGWVIAGAPGGNVRNPVFAGRFYPGRTAELAQTVNDLLQKGKGRPLSGSLRALIMPHAGIIYSGLTAGYAAARIDNSRFSKVIIMGPDHWTGFSGCSVSDADGWQTPLGTVPIHPDTRRLLGSPDLFHTHPVSEKREHSIEVILPFIQAAIDDFNLVPVVAGQCDIEKTAGKIDALIDDTTLLIASTDLSHYLPYETAVIKDRQTVSMILAGDSAALAGAENAACGQAPVRILMDIARKRNWRPVLLHYSNSGDTAGDRSRVVGYCAIAYISNSDRETAPEFTDTQGQYLLRVARQAIARALDVRNGASVDNRPPDDGLDCERATFVTLYLGGRLRGCIGSLQAREPLIDNIRKNAVSAARHDPRFPELTPEEFKRVRIEISILTPPRPLAYENGPDLPRKLIPFQDGVVIRKGGHRATYLPQVWEQLPEPEAFLSRLCQKAGLPSHEWETGSLTVSTYQVRHFKEEE